MVQTDSTRTGKEVVWGMNVALCRLWKQLNNPAQLSMLSLTQGSSISERLRNWVVGYLSVYEGWVKGNVKLSQARTTFQATGTLHNLGKIGIQVSTIWLFWKLNVVRGRDYSALEEWCLIIHTKRMFKHEELLRRNLKVCETLPPRE